MTTEQNKTLVRRLLDEVWGKGNATLLPEVFSRDICDHNPAPGQPRGLEGQRWAVDMFMGAISNVQMKIDDLVAEGDRVYDRWTFSATHTGNLMGIPASGKRFTMTGSDESRIDNGKIAEIWHVEDFLGVMQQTGAIAANRPQFREGQFGSRSAGMTGGVPGGKRLSEREQKDLIRSAFTELLDRGNLDAADTLVTPDYVGHFAGFPTVYGPDGLKRFLTIYTSALSNRHTDVEDVIVEGDRAACRATYHGRQTGDFMGIAPTGKETHTHGMHIFRLAGDRVSEQWANNEDILLLQQLGVVPEPAEAVMPC